MREWIVPTEDIGVDGAYFGYQEILRCRDCKYFNGDNEYCDYETMAISEGFCYLAERKDENGK